MRKKYVLGTVAAGVTALAVTNPLVADAARLITSADIANGTIQSRDIDNKTIKGKDIAPKAVKSWNIANDQVFSKDIHDGTIRSKDIAPGVLPVAAYGRVTADSSAATLDTAKSSNIASVTRTGTGVYCLELAAGVDRNVAVMAQAEGGTANFATDEAAWSGPCGTNGVQVSTEELSTSGGALVSTPVNDISFNVVVP